MGSIAMRYKAQRSTDHFTFFGIKILQEILIISYCENHIKTKVFPYAGFYLGYLRGRSFPPKIPSFPLPPPHPPQKYIYCYHYSI